MSGHILVLSPQRESGAHEPGRGLPTFTHMQVMGSGGWQGRKKCKTKPRLRNFMYRVLTHKGLVSEEQYDVGLRPTRNID
jgi:hypothetical protein